MTIARRSGKIIAHFSSILPSRYLASPALKIGPIQASQFSSSSQSHQKRTYSTNALYAGISVCTAAIAGIALTQTGKAAENPESPNARSGPLTLSGYYSKEINGEKLTIARRSPEDNWEVFVRKEDWSRVKKEGMSLADLIFSDQNASKLALKELAEDPSFPDLARRFFEEENNDLLFSLDSDNLLFLLSYATKTLSPPIKPNLHRPLTDGKTLLQKLLTGYKTEDLIELILELDPEALLHKGTDEVSFFVQTALEGYRERALLFLQKIKEHGLPLEPIDVWCEKLLNNTLSFSDDEFLQLPSATQKQIYRLGNLFRDKELVKRLNSLGMKNETMQVDPGSYFGPGMDIVTIEERVQDLFMKMRQRGDLLTEEEYQKRYPKYEEGVNKRMCYEGNGFFYKTNCISRLFGALYFNKQAGESTYTKAVRKIVVVKGTDFKFYPRDVNQNFISLQNNSAFEESKDDSLQVKAEYIPYDEESYEPNAEESMDLVKTLEKVGYCDLHPGMNVRLTKKGAYVIDNELRNLFPFGRMEYGKLLGRFPLHSDAAAYVEEKLKKIEEEIAYNEKKIKETKETVSQEKAYALLLEKGSERRKTMYSVGLDLGELCEKPISVDISSVLKKPLGFRTNRVQVIVPLKKGERLEVIGEGPSMTWKSGVVAKSLNDTTQVIDMPEGNYDYKLAIRRPDGSFSPENIATNRSYRFRKNQEIITFDKL